MSQCWGAEGHVHVPVLGCRGPCPCPSASAAAPAGRAALAQQHCCHWSSVSSVSGSCVRAGCLYEHLWVPCSSPFSLAGPESLWPPVATKGQGALLWGCASGFAIHPGSPSWPGLSKPHFWGDTIQGCIATLWTGGGIRQLPSHGACRSQGTMLWWPPLPASAVPPERGFPISGGAAGSGLLMRSWGR